MEIFKRLLVIVAFPTIWLAANTAISKGHQTPARDCFLFNPDFSLVGGTIKESFKRLLAIVSQASRRQFSASNACSRLFPFQSGYESKILNAHKKASNAYSRLLPFQLPDGRVDRGRFVSRLSLHFSICGGILQHARLKEKNLLPLHFVRSASAHPFTC